MNETMQKMCEWGNKTYYLLVTLVNETDGNDDDDNDHKFDARKIYKHLCSSFFFFGWSKNEEGY